MLIAVFDFEKYGSKYTLRPIEELRDLHDVAAVAWDRDCADVELGGCPCQPRNHPLRFDPFSHGRVFAYTGSLCEHQMSEWSWVAYWDREALRWVRRKPADGWAP